MRKNLIIIFLVFTNTFTLTSCFRGYSSYEEIVESRSHIKPLTFEKEKWFDDRGIGVEALWESRPGLARDLVHRNLLIGKSYTEVQELLGEEQKDVTENAITYSLYYEMGFADPVYTEQFYIKFNDSDLVESNEIRIRMMRGHPNYH